VIRAEKASGTRRDGRTELQVLLRVVQPGRHPLDPSHESKKLKMAPLAFAAT
jgi:hypothetical protein